MNCSGRKWKEKMKEWDFEKNVPTKDRRFIVAKARKRELEEGKQTMFSRNGMRIDHDKIESFKKKKLNEDNAVSPSTPGEFSIQFIKYRLTSIATPQHISYETPKPEAINESPPNHPEHEHDWHAASDQVLITGVKEDSASADDLYAASPVQRSTEPAGRSMAELRLSMRIHPVNEPNSSPTSLFVGRLSELSSSDRMDRNMRDSASSTEKIRSWVVPGDPEDILKANSVSLGQPEKAGALVDPIATVKTVIESIRAARPLFEHGEGPTAAGAYCKALQGFIEDGRGQDDLDFEIFVNVLAAIFGSCTEDEETPAVLRIALDLLKTLFRSHGKISVIRPIFLESLEFRLAEYLGVSQGSIRKLIAALDDPVLNVQLFAALHSFLETARGELGIPLDLETRRTRLGILALACELEGYLSPEHEGTRYLQIVISRLHQAVADVLESTHWFREELRELKDKTHSMLSSPPVGSMSSSRSAKLVTCYPSIELLVTKLASACSKAGWSYEAEALFAVLRNIQSLPNLDHWRKFELLIQYCRHLETEKRYAELLTELYNSYAYIVSARRADGAIHVQNIEYIRESKEIFDRISFSQLQSLLSKSTQAHDMLRLGDMSQRIRYLSRMLTADPTREVILDSNNEERARHINLVEYDQGSDDEEQQLDDSKSSNRFGITYTESVITGISFNYSDLYR